jgi:hypothetical protein
MASNIKAVREQNAIKIFCLPNRKISCAYSPYAPNELKLALTQQIIAQYEKNVRSFLSILDKMQ